MIDFKERLRSYLLEEVSRRGYEKTFSSKLHRGFLYQVMLYDYTDMLTMAEKRWMGFCTYLQYILKIGKHIKEWEEYPDLIELLPELDQQKLGHFSEQGLSLDPKAGGGFHYPYHGYADTGVEMRITAIKDAMTLLTNTIKHEEE